MGITPWKSVDLHPCKTGVKKERGSGTGPDSDLPLVRHRCTSIGVCGMLLDLQCFAWHLASPWERVKARRSHKSWHCCDSLATFLSRLSQICQTVFMLLARQLISLSACFPCGLTPFCASLNRGTGLHTEEQTSLKPTWLLLALPLLISCFHQSSADAGTG